MNFRFLAVIASVFLGAAAAPPNDCANTPPVGQVVPTATDLAGRPIAPSGLSAQNYATLPQAEGTGGCKSPLSAAAQSTNLRNEEDDVLHGLPTPDILQPMDETKKSPRFQ